MQKKHSDPGDSNLSGPLIWNTLQVKFFSTSSRYVVDEKGGKNKFSGDITTFIYQREIFTWCHPINTHPVYFSKHLEYIARLLPKSNIANDHTETLKTLSHAKEVQSHSVKCYCNTLYVGN